MTKGNLTVAIELARTRSPQTAEVLRQALQNQQIDAWVIRRRDSWLFRMLGVAAVYGVVVPEKDTERARALQTATRNWQPNRLP